MQKKREALYPGTFDPITNGHLDILCRAQSIFGKVLVGVAKEPAKETLFSYPERLHLVKEATIRMTGVRVEGFGGLVVDFARAHKIKVIIRGLRMLSDFEYEFQMALTNKSLAVEIETVFLMSHPEYAYISARLLKEAFSLGADIRRFVPAVVIGALKRKYLEGKHIQY